MSAGKVKGIDVSHHNGAINWSQVKSAGVQFVYIKATEGRTYTDPTFLTNVKGVKAAGLKVGAYHFANPANRASDDAANFINALKKIDYDLMPVLDLESAPTGMTAAQLVAWAKDFLSRVEAATGKRAMIYTGVWFANKYAGFNSALADRPLWVSYYKTTLPSSFAGWTKWTAWQYTDSGKIVGISGNVDLNIAESLDDLLADTVAAYDANPAFHRALSLTSPYMRGADVKAVQERLGSKPDGIFGPKTKADVEMWQAHHDMDATGAVDEMTWRALFNHENDYDKNEKYHRSLSYTIPMMRGADVERLQGRLKIPINGFFGPKTRESLIMWQERHDADGNAVEVGKGLRPSGGVDETTWFALFPDDRPEEPTQPQPEPEQPAPQPTPEAPSNPSPEPKPEPEKPQDPKPEPAEPAPAESGEQPEPPKEDKPVKNNPFACIDWKARLRNRWFLMAVGAFILRMLTSHGLLDQAIANEYEQYINEILDLLMFVGIVVDPTSKGISDDQKSEESAQEKAQENAQ